MTLEKLEALEKAATPKWGSGSYERGQIYAAMHGAPIAVFRMEYPLGEANPRLAVAARNALPTLLKIARAAKETASFYPQSVAQAGTLGRIKDALAELESLPD